MVIRSYTLGDGASWLTTPQDSFRQSPSGGSTRVVVSPDGRTVSYVYTEGK